MAFQVLDTQLLQSAIKAAASVTSAMVQAGVEDVKDDPAGYMDTLADDLFGKLKAVADKDNEALREEAAKNPKPAGGGWKPSGGGNKSGGFKGKAPDDGSLTLSWGSFKGKTIAQVYAMDAAEAEEYGYATGSGAKYIQWLSGNDKNAYAAAHAKAFLDSKKA